MDIQRSKTCCFTGHRPKFFPWGSNTGDPAAAKMLHALESEILQAIADGYTTFLYGGALGVDTWATRDRYMVGHSSRLIAVYDERSQIHSGTWRALCYAREKQLDIRQIRWMKHL